MTVKYLTAATYDLLDVSLNSAVHGISVSGILGAGAYAQRLVTLNVTLNADRAAMAADLASQINAATIGPTVIAAGVTTLKAVNVPGTSIVTIVMWTTAAVSGKVQVTHGPSTTPYDMRQMITGVAGPIAVETVVSADYTQTVLAGVLGLAVGAMATK